MKKETLKKLIEICSSNLRTSSMSVDCVRYLFSDRNISPEIVKKYNLGYFPRNISKVKDFLNTKDLCDLKIINKIGGSDFSDFFYLIIPIYDEYGDPVGFGGRTLLEPLERKKFGIPKYKNTSYKKGYILYGLNLARRSVLLNDNVYVVEGFFDQISMYKNGYKNTVAICGTSFSYEHFYMLAKYTTKITFILDSDKPGILAMKNISKKFSNKGVLLRFKALPVRYKDVDEYFASEPSGSIDSIVKTFMPEWPEDM